MSINFDLNDTLHKSTRRTDLKKTFFNITDLLRGLSFFSYDVPVSPRLSQKLFVTKNGINGTLSIGTTIEIIRIIAILYLTTFYE